MAIIPPYLKKGDTIGIVCPAGYMPYDKARICIDVLQQWGYKVQVGKTLGNQHNYFSGSDEERLSDLQQMLDDDNIQAILCGRGGYGMGRIIEQVDFKKFRKKPKWVIGFSDITVFHSHIYRRFNIAGLHAPMAAAFNDDGYKNDYVQSLKKALKGRKARYTAAVHSYNNTGKATGELIGGNLSILAHIIGTSSDIKTKGKILFIEDIGEYIYNIDRMMYQLKRSGKLDGLAGLVVGKFSDMKDTTVPYGYDVKEVIKEVVKSYRFPICFEFPVGHDGENYALKIAVKYELKVGIHKVSLVEL
jgi:muramoyltetrapeptide carboxypeptidase